MTTTSSSITVRFLVPTAAAHSHSPHFHFADFAPDATVEDLYLHAQQRIVGVPPVPGAGALQLLVEAYADGPLMKLRRETPGPLVRLPFCAGGLCAVEVHVPGAVTASTPAGSPARATSVSVRPSPRESPSQRGRASSGGGGGGGTVSYVPTGQAEAQAYVQRFSRTLPPPAFHDHGGAGGEAGSGGGGGGPPLIGPAGGVRTRSVSAGGPSRDRHPSGGVVKGGAGGGGGSGGRGGGGIGGRRGGGGGAPEAAEPLNGGGGDGTIEITDESYYEAHVLGHPYSRLTATEQHDQDITVSKSLNVALGREIDTLGEKMTCVVCPGSVLCTGQ
jgi:hypothetical protein